jgi:hypothetical protein
MRHLPNFRRPAGLKVDTGADQKSSCRTEHALDASFSPIDGPPPQRSLVTWAAGRDFMCATVDAPRCSQKRARRCRIQRFGRAKKTRRCRVNTITRKPLGRSILEPNRA